MSLWLSSEIMSTIRGLPWAVAAQVPGACLPVPATLSTTASTGTAFPLRPAPHCRNLLVEWEWEHSIIAEVTTVAPSLARAFSPFPRKVSIAFSLVTLRRPGGTGFPSFFAPCFPTEPSGTPKPTSLLRCKPPPRPEDILRDDTRSTSHGLRTDSRPSISIQERQANTYSGSHPTSRPGLALFSAAKSARLRSSPSISFCRLLSSYTHLSRPPKTFAMWRQAFRNGMGSFTAGGGAARAAASGGPVTIYRTRIKPRKGPVRCVFFSPVPLHVHLSADERLHPGEPWRPDLPPACAFTSGDL